MTSYPGIERKNSQKRYGHSTFKRKIQGYITLCVESSASESYSVKDLVHFPLANIRDQLDLLDSFVVHIFVTIKFQLSSVSQADGQKS